MTSARILFFGLMLCAVTVLPACGTTSNSDVSPAAQTGTDFGTNVTIPPNFPSDIPQYPGAITRVVLGDATQNSVSLQQQTADSLNTVRQMEEQALVAAGYTKGLDLTEEHSVMLTYDKGTSHIQVQLVRDVAKNLTNILISRTQQ